MSRAFLVKLGIRSCQAIPVTMLRVIVFSLCLVACMAAKSYEGYQVLRMPSLDAAQVEALQPFQDVQGLDFWDYPRDLMVSPSQLESVTEYLGAHNIVYNVWIENVQKLIDNQFSTDRVPSVQFDYSVYHPLNEIYAWIDEMLTTYPSLTSKFSIGTSTEGNDLTVLKIGADTGKQKRSVWVNSLIHAREWVAGATTMYIADRLMTEFSTVTDIQFLLETYDIYLLTVTNPDGYAFTWAQNGDRMWRKTRSVNAGSNCLGTDANRNFDYMWGGEGASPLVCSDTYRGSSAFSEPETQAIADFIRGRPAAEIMDVFIDYHSYSQLMLSPWGYTPSLPADYATMDAAMKASTDAIFAVHGKTYVYGASGPTLYATSGTTVDWGYGDRSVVHSYTYELRDEGQFGFLLPEGQIIPCGEENYAGLTTLLLHINGM